MHMQNDMLKKIISGVVVFAVVIAGLWFAWNLTTKPANQAETNKVVPIEITETDHKKGAVESQVMLVEFSDFQCPACRVFTPLVNQLVDELGEDFTLVYKHFPLPQHNNAEQAAFVAEAAGKQDKFFEMHDVLFEKQDEWSESDNPKKFFDTYAKDLKLDMKKFSTDVTSAEVKAKVEKDVISGTEAGVNSTPSFFLNGVKLKNPGSYDEFAGIIKAAITESKKKVQESTSSATIGQPTGVTGTERSK